MKLFSRKPVWRDRNGSIVCKGNACTKECDNRCPIWLNTVALQFLQKGDADRAIVLLTDAIEIAPDFPDLFNNLGSAYGMNNQHEAAHQAFVAAYRMKPKYMAALLGMIVSEKNLGMYTEAVQHCKEYEDWGGDGSELRKSIREALEADKVAEKENVLDKLLNMGRETGYITSLGTPVIPEILGWAEPVCQRLLVDISRFFAAHPNSTGNPVSLTLLWSAFAGMGAVYHWHVDWERLSKVGIYETLTAEKGIFGMDEYVLEIVGIQAQGNEYGRLTRFLQSLVDCCIDDMKSRNKEQKKFLEYAKAMYAWGMVFEMNRLGMK